jgi:hypothetical protein
VRDVAQAVAGALGGQPAPEERLREADEQHGVDRGDEAVGWDREGTPRLLDPAQVDDGQHDHEADRQRHRMGRERGNRAGDGGNARDDRDGDREDVVDQQRGGGDQGRVLAEVPAAHGVRAATVRIGVTRLAVGGDDDHQQRDDRRSQPRRQIEEPQSPEAEDEDDLLGRVGD